MPPCVTDLSLERVDFEHTRTRHARDDQARVLNQRPYSVIDTSLIITYLHRNPSGALRRHLKCRFGLLSYRND
ncbi:hypothetical protein C8R48DRAFT_373269 [Suillus tomentosus]|nr:hypothetical protein C8R48DRAFT_373269 [Suillus tomentosus]